MKISNIFELSENVGKKRLIIDNNNQFKQFGSELGKDWLQILKGKNVLQDTLSAITVASVALPLNIALAVACGLPASSGLLAGAIGGGLAAIFGGSHLQVTGPAAALNVMVLAITKDYGAIGVCFACLFIGCFQILLSFISAGKFIKFVPEAVLAGFTTGVGIKLLDSQIPELFGFDYSVMHILKSINDPKWLHEVSWFAVICGLFVAFLVTSCKQFKRFPASFIAIVIVTALSVHLNWNIERVGLIPGSLPIPKFPFIESEKIFNLLFATIPLAILASVESLLSAQAIDRMTNTKKPHNSNLELFGQGIGNLGSGLVGGMPVSGVIVRSTVNVQSGAKTRFSALLHAILLIASILYLSQIMAAIPLAALSGLLCVVGLRLVEFKSFFHFLKENKFEALAFIITAIGTISGHLMLGLILGIGIYFFDKLFHKNENSREKNEIKNAVRPNNIRALISHLGTQEQVKKNKHNEVSKEKNSWFEQIRDKASFAASAFVHQKASIIGNVILGEQVHIAAESSIRADEGSPFYIGDYSNIQDGVVIHALKEKWVSVGNEDWAVYIGQNVSVAHQALVHGPCFIGNNSFIGFQAIVHDSVIGSHCYIGIGAIVVGVEIPEGRYVPHGMVVDSYDKVELLPKVTDAHLHFNDDVVEVNKGLVKAYKKHNNLISDKKMSLFSFSSKHGLQNDKF